MKVLVCWESQTTEGRLVSGHGFQTVEHLNEFTLNSIVRGIAKNIRQNVGISLGDPHTGSGVILRSVTKLDA